jgi:hypothetical protein
MGPPEPLHLLLTGIMHKTGVLPPFHLTTRHIISIQHRFENENRFQVLKRKCGYVKGRISNSRKKKVEYL